MIIKNIVKIKNKLQINKNYLWDLLLIIIVNNFIIVIMKLILLAKQITLRISYLKRVTN